MISDIRKFISLISTSTMISFSELSILKSKCICLITFINSSMKIHKDNMEKVKDFMAKNETDGTEIYKCQDQHKSGHFFDFLPVLIGSIKEKTQKITYEGLCFKELIFSIDFNENVKEADTISVTVEAKEKKSMLCKEWMFMTLTEKHHVEYFFMEGLHKFEFKNLNLDDMMDFQAGGMRLYLFCHGVTETFTSVFNTLRLFIGGLGSDPNPWIPLFSSHVPDYMDRANKEFLKDAVGWDMEEREIQEVVVDESFINSGDFFVATRMDGLDQIIMWGTGTRSGHSVGCLRIDGELFIVES